MEVLGYILLVLLAVFVLIGLFTLIVSLPDISRYRRLRRM